MSQYLNFVNNGGVPMSQFVASVTLLAIVMFPS